MSKTTNAELLAMYGNPGSLQYKLLRSMENSLGNGRIISSPNNVASVMIEQFSTIGSGLLQDTVSEFIKMFPTQATTAEDLFKHISDYEYVALYSTPASTQLEITMFVDDIKEAMTPVEGKEYHRVVLPRYSKFNVGGYIFSNYYSVEIRGTPRGELPIISVVYDDETDAGTRIVHPLHNLTDDNIEHQVIKSGGYSLLTIRLPVYQFVRTSTTLDLFTNAPFSKRIAFNDRFYAVRVFTNTEYTSTSTISLNDTLYEGEVYTDADGVIWTELGQTIESDIYDISTSVVPSVIIQPDTVNHIVKVTVPQVFLTENRLGDRIKIDVYSTSGEISTIADIRTPVVGEFIFSDVPNYYTHGLMNMAGISIYPLNEIVSGGGNGVDFETFRNTIVYSGAKAHTIVGETELENEFAKEHFNVVRFKDGITRRILFMEKRLTLDNTGITSGTIDTALDLTRSIYGIIRHEDGSVTITPKMLSLYDPSNNIATPVETDHALINTVTPSQIVALNNADLYLTTPFHVFISEINGVALATSYELTAPSFDWLTVVNDSDNEAYSVAVLDGEITYNATEDTYTIKLYIQGAEADSESYTESLSMTLSIPTSTGTLVLTSTELEGSVESGIYFSFTLATSYRFNKDAWMYVESDGQSGYVELHSRCTTNLTSVLTGSGSTIEIAATHQFDVTFGTQLSMLFNDVRLSTTAARRIEYEEDVYATHEHPVFRTYPTLINDVLVDLPYNPNAAEGEDPWEVLHHVGDTIYEQAYVINTSTTSLSGYLGYFTEVNSVMTKLTEANYASFSGTVILYTPIILHAKGSPRLDSFGEIQYYDRSKMYYVGLIQISNRTQYQPRNNENIGTSTMTSIRGLIKNYCSIAESYVGRLLGNTELYYHPAKALGTATCLLGNNYEEQFSLEIALRFKLYLTKVAYNSTTIRTSIRSTIIELVDNYFEKGVGCSMAVLSNLILDALEGKVTSIDILGINGDVSIQTVIPVDPANRLALAHRMILDANLYPSTERALDLEFVCSE